MRSTSVKTAELKAHLSKYLRQVRKGQRVVVLDRDRPIAEILPLEDNGDVFVRLAREGKCRLGSQKRDGLKITPLKRDFALEELVVDRVLDADLP